MAGDYSFYQGWGYGLDAEAPPSPLGFSYAQRFNAGDFGLTTDPRTSHQLKAVSDKLSTGAKIVEITGITPEILEYVPKQQFKEIERLKKLVGAEITFHGPLVEATGITQQGWDESKREQAERQIFNALEKSRMVGPNTIFTLHTTSGLPEMKTEVFTTEDGKKVKRVTDIWVVDEWDKRFSQIPIKKDFLLNEKPDAEKELKKLNEENWSKLLTQVSFHAHQGKQVLDNMDHKLKVKLQTELPESNFMEFYKLAQTPEGLKEIESRPLEEKKVIKEIINDMNYSDIYIRDAYNELKNLFNKAWLSAEQGGKKEDIQKLDEYRQELQKKVTAFKDPFKLPELADEVVKGVRILSTLSETPKMLKPLNEFAIDKASQTYANIAFKAYKEYGDTAPIISLENPPAGGGLSKAEDMRTLVEETRKKFVEQAVQQGISESQAKKNAEKLIGVTWDVGHINMLRKYGYDKEALLEQTKTIAPYVKHVHLSDNFGLEHTELPMGMGNVPTKEMLDIISKYNKQVKKIIETGGWYQHFKKSPLTETFEAFGSPLGAAADAPNWTQAYGLGGAGNYFAGLGMNPDIHHSIYGAGFSNLPAELGGQLPGRGGSRFSGTPME